MSSDSENEAQGAIEEMYQKKTQLEHILLRPDSYVGSIKNDEKMLWVYDNDKMAMVERKVTFNPALYKIFDEILVNASDNKMRDSKMTTIQITIDSPNNMVKIWNNGKGIPVTIHKEHNVYVPTLIFGHLLTSTNFNDDQKKVVGGRNGYGAKLCNIFSTQFTVETSSLEYKKCFKQTWNSNMSTASDPIIGNSTKSDFTCVTFHPDLKRFGMTSLDKDIVDLFSRRAYDIAACTNGVTVFLNGQQLPIKCFKDYIDLYIKDVVDCNGEPLKLVHEKFGDRWEVAMTMSVTEQFTQVSFVNSIATTKGGTHVNYVTDQAALKLLEIAKKKIKDDKQAVKLKSAQVKMNLWVFVKSLIENPSFDSQTKENMTLQQKDFGSICNLTDKFINQVAKSGVIERMTMWAQFKNQALMDKKCSKSKQVKLKGIPKLDDANNAGTKNSLSCTLILTEGDSAKTLAVAGLSVIGRDNFGVFPLRGKLLNVREANAKQLLENVEINNLIKILGLQYKQKYDTPDSMKTLRYGKIMIMTDQDQDGSHIKGLIINFIHTAWPNLLKNNFVEQFITPIIKATKGPKILSFFSIPEYNEWVNSFPEAKNYHVKYYKGLGTSTGKEAKEYFNDMHRHLIKFKYSGIEDEQSIILAFGKNKADDRKLWLTEWMEECKRRKVLGLEEEYLYAKDTKQVTFTNFVRKELVLFSNTDNERSIPSIVDGLKPGQRKVMFACFKRNLIREIKVAQLAGSVAELSSYHHGEASLMGTIVNLAQDFVGSNNINLLEPRGQFGTRLHGGKDSASARYIFTQLSPVAKLIFHPDDNAILNNLYDDNQKIEPEWYVPVIPMVLVNGSDGIGTGWSSKVPNFNPKEIIANIRNLLVDQPMKKMHPWYRGFKGTIKEVCENKYIISGEICSLGANTVEIIELPVKTWTQSYKENVVEVLLNGTEKIAPAILDFKEYHTDTTVRFIVEMSPEKYGQAERMGIYKFLKLQTSLTCSNMVLFDELGVIRKYNTPEEIITTFYKVRLDMYFKRKVYLEGMLSAVALKLQNQARFILEKIDGVIICENIKIKELLALLEKRKYDSDPVDVWKKTTEKLETLETESSDEAEKEDTKLDYRYLTSMQIISLTTEKKDDLLKERDTKNEELRRLKLKTPKDLWNEDLNALEKCLAEVENEEKIQSSKQFKVAAVSSTKNKGKGIQVAAETAPSKFGIRIEPTIDEEYLKKISVDIEKKKKLSNDKKQKDMMTQYFVPQEDGDTRATTNNDVMEVDDDVVIDDEDEPMSLAQRMAAKGIEGMNVLKNDPKKKVQRKEKDSEGKNSQKKKKNAWDSDDENDVKVISQREPNLKRSVTKDAISYNDGSVDENDGLSVDEVVMTKVTMEKIKPLKQTKLFSKKDSKDIDDVPPAKKMKTAVVKSNVVSKPKVERKPKTDKKDIVPKTKVKNIKSKPNPQQKRKIGSSDEDFRKIVDVYEPVISTKPRREVKKVIHQVFDSDSDDENENVEPMDSDFDFDSEINKKVINHKKARIIDSD